MSAIVKFVKPEHEDIIRDYLSDGGVILVMGKDVQDALTAKGVSDEELIEYEFGGSPDRVVDFVSSTSHFLFSELSESDCSLDEG